MEVKEMDTEGSFCGVDTSAAFARMTPCCSIDGARCRLRRRRLAEALRNSFPRDDSATDEDYGEVVETVVTRKYLRRFNVELLSSIVQVMKRSERHVL